MKKIIAALTCALLAPLAFAQTNSTSVTTTTTTERVTVTGTVVNVTAEGGTATAYQPSNTLLIRVDGSQNMGRYVMNGLGNVVDKAGRIVDTPVKPGTHVQVFYVDNGETRIIDHIVVDQ